MGADNVVVLAFALVVLVLFSAVFVEYIAPMYKKAHFDEICRNYLLIAEANNGLTALQQERLLQEIESLGLTDVDINISSKDSVARRAIMSLDIECRYIYSSPAEFLRRETRELIFKFARYFVARRIVE